MTCLTGGQDLLITLPDGSPFPYPIEEIEVHPETLELYALARAGNAIRLYRIENTGVATMMSIMNGSQPVFRTECWIFCCHAFPKVNLARSRCGPSRNHGTASLLEE